VIDMEWRHLAYCRGEEPELFFPVGTTGPALDQLSRAKSVCHRCPVASECLAWALDTGQRAGVWGGLSEEERLELRQQVTRQTTTIVLITVPAAAGPTEPRRSGPAELLDDRVRSVTGSPRERA
jgi:WhiB family redox-sensing transcriptional regulator